MDELRSEYLFDFAHLCHIPPPMVGAGLRYLDFIQIILNIEAYYEAQKRANGG